MLQKLMGKRFKELSGPLSSWQLEGESSLGELWSPVRWELWGNAIVCHFEFKILGKGVSGVWFEEWLIEAIMGYEKLDPNCPRSAHYSTGRNSVGTKRKSRKNKAHQLCCPHTVKSRVVKREVNIGWRGFLIGYLHSYWERISCRQNETQMKEGCSRVYQWRE